MDYTVWATEYQKNAYLLLQTIEKLKRKKMSCTYTEGLELDEKIRKYRNIRYECLKIANLLERRAAS